MAMLITTIEDITVRCPNCGKPTQALDVEIACTASGVDVVVSGDDGVNHCMCDHCGGVFTLFAHCDVDVYPAAKEAA